MANKKVLMLIIILLLGLFLRVYKIGSESFWVDESSTAFALKTYNPNQIAKNILYIGNVLPQYYDTRGELIVYFFTISYWAKLFSVSEISLRVYSVIFGVLSILFVYLAARQLFGEKNAMLSSFLMAISLPAIAFSQEARHYTLYLFLAIASIYYFIKALESNKSHHWAAYLLFTALGLYTHFIFTVLLIFQGMYLVYHLVIIEGCHAKSIFRGIAKKNSKIKKILLVYSIISLLIIPLAIRIFEGSTAEPWWGKPTMGKAIRMFMNFSTWIYPTFEAKEKIKQGLILGLSLPDLLLFLSVALVAAMSYSLILYFSYQKAKSTSFKDFMKENKFILVLGWFSFPLLFSLILAVVTPINIFGIFQYFFYCIAPFIMLLSESMISLKPKAFRLIFAAFVLLSIMPLYAYYSNVDKQQWGELADYMKGRIKSNEPVIISGDSGEVALRYYYGNSEDLHGVENLEEVKEIIKDKKSLWLVLSFWKYQDPRGLIQEYISRNYEISESKSFFDIEVYHFQKKD